MSPGETSEFTFTSVYKMLISRNSKWDTPYLRLPLDFWPFRFWGFFTAQGYALCSSELQENIFRTHSCQSMTEYNETNTHPWRLCALCLYNHVERLKRLWGFIGRHTLFTTIQATMRAHIDTQVNIQVGTDPHTGHKEGGTVTTERQTRRLATAKAKTKNSQPLAQSHIYSEFCQE